MTRWRVAAGAAAGTLLLIACGDESEPAPAPGGDPAGPPWLEEVSVVVLGDSIPSATASECDDCVSFADGYGEALAEKFGAEVEVRNLARRDGARTSDIRDQLVAGGLDDALVGAEIVIVSMGFDDQPPYTELEQPCHTAEPTTAADAVAAVAATTTDCVDEVTGMLRVVAAQALGEVRARAPRAAIAALVPYDAWIGWSALDAVPAPMRRAATDLVSYALDAWSRALCGEVASVNGVCVDVREEFNGPSRQRAADRFLAADHTHPSERGNDRISSLLLDAELAEHMP